jgi:hypothetical protein
VQAIAEELDASQQRREMIAPAMLPVISRDANHYDSQIYAVCGGGALLPSGGFDCCERRFQRNSSAYSQRSEARHPVTPWRDGYALNSVVLIPHRKAT